MAGFADQIIELWPEGAPLAAGNSDEDRPAITPYLIEGSNGAVIVCPGGGYGMRADHEGEPIALWLNSIGISAFVLRYRVAPYQYPCALNDVQRAIRHVRLHAEEWGLDSGKIGVLGFSAGGHLVASAGTLYDSGHPNAADPVDRQSSRPDFIILCYPVITMEKPYTHEGSLHNLLGTEPDELLVSRLSGERQVTSDTPPTFLWHTSDDGAVPIENSLAFAAALSHAGVPFDLHVYEKGPHGLGLAKEDEHVATWTTVCALWLKRYGL
ncbi:acetylesterase [Paenibacillus baekrokdamisoli]|uniref:Acetylesterase n=1 Tax=Paenibacillus baekrokdamisoli TaxID=1712516 RepID=A0A3G9IKU7_9BACL|nr:alpha/beta hydrolase [Paenibacillus baekrokdamisoli]MBB3072652.1 acetyl esterase/lipase [Paenibacillus baekrokdamisoli]BBH18936.1 acetylesterase [Paenibacillus baekrokdamisoli]